MDNTEDRRSLREITSSLYSRETNVEIHHLERFPIKNGKKMAASRTVGPACYADSGDIYSIPSLMYCVKNQLHLQRVLWKKATMEVYWPAK